MTISEAFQLCMQPLTWSLDFFVSIMYHANALPVYVAFFFIYTVMRLVLRPLIGEAHRDAHNELRKNARNVIKKSQGEGSEG